MVEHYLTNEEVWKDIPGFEGEYQASTFGRIRSLDVLKEYVNFKGTYCKQRKEGKILKPFPSAGGYMAVTLYKECVAKDWFVHRLLAITFIENPKKFKTVRFKDGNKYNINLKNLMWGRKG